MTDKPLLYYRTNEEIEAYRKKPAIEKLRWFEAQMGYFTRRCPKRAKEIRDNLQASCHGRCDYL